MQAIKNNQGMMCQLTGIAYGPDGNEFYNRIVYALDIVGANTAVKAIWASLCSGSPMKTFGISANHYRFSGDKEAKYRTFSSQPLPRITHYHIVPGPRPDADYFIITALTAESREIALYDVLRLYTPHPVLPGWGKTLFELGLSINYGLISELEVVGTDWAYRIEAIGWDALIDEAAKECSITVPEVSSG